MNEIETTGSSIKTFHLKTFTGDPNSDVLAYSIQINKKKEKCIEKKVFVLSEEELEKKHVEVQKKK